MAKRQNNNLSLVDNNRSFCTKKNNLIFHTKKIIFIAFVKKFDKLCYPETE